MSTKGFKITIEYYLPNMIDEESLRDEFDNDLEECYRFISDNFNDSILNFIDSRDQEKIIKIETF